MPNKLQPLMFPGLPLSKYSKQIARINLISSGPGSVIVAPNVKSVELIFRQRAHTEHTGAKKFWKENLPRVQFFNPDLPIKVVRVEVDSKNKDKVPALMKIEYTDKEPQQIDMKQKKSSRILNGFISLTAATPAEEIINDRPPIRARA